MNQYQSWQAFTFKGVRYLALTHRGGQSCLIVGEDMANYGTYYDVPSFKSFVESHAGEDLSLGSF